MELKERKEKEVFHKKMNDMAKKHPENFLIIDDFFLGVLGINNVELISKYITTELNSFIKKNQTIENFKILIIKT